MPLRLKTKFTLATALLVLAVVALISALYVATVTHQVISQANSRSRFIAQQVFLQAQHALSDAAEQGTAPASSRPEDMHEYVRQALEESAALTSLIEAEVGYSLLIYEVTIIDREGTALISSDASLPGRPLLRADRLEQLVHSNFIEQLRVLYGPPRVYEVSLPFKLGSEPFGEIRIAVQTGLLRNEVSPGLRSAGWLVLGAVLVSTLLAGVVSHVSLAPLARISAQLDRISAGEFESEPARLTELAGRDDEFGQVSEKISRIGQQLRDVRKTSKTREESSLERISIQLKVSERLAALARVTAGAAHEVKNPLNSMRLWIENLKESLPEGQAVPQQAVKVLDSEIDRLDRVVKRLLDFYRPTELHLEETDVAGVLAEVLEVVKPQMERAHVDGATQVPGDVPPVRADRQLIKQAILNLVLNAVEAMPNGGRLAVALARRGEMAEIRVADTGCGIAPQHRGRIFQLFFTTRPGGSGIGLASAFRIVQLHNGSIDFESAVGRGTTFRVELPLAPSFDFVRDK